MHSSLRWWQWQYFPQFLILLHLALIRNVIICIMCFGRWYQVSLFLSNVGSFGLQVGKPGFLRSYELCVWIHNTKARCCRSLQVLKHSLHTMVEKRDVYTCATCCYQVCKLLGLWCCMLLFTKSLEQCCLLSISVEFCCFANFHASVAYFRKLVKQ